MTITLDAWYWYRHPIWGWLEVQPMSLVEPKVFKCWSPPTMIYLLNQTDLKKRRSSGKVYPHTPGKIDHLGRPR